MERVVTPVAPKSLPVLRASLWCRWPGAPFWLAGTTNLLRGSRWTINSSLISGLSVAYLFVGFFHLGF